MNTFFDQLKLRLRRKDAFVILLAINVAVFLLFTLLRIVVSFGQGNVGLLSVSGFFEDIFFFNTNFHFFLTHPWTIVTSIFTHVTFMHILFNLLVFYFAGEVFVHYFGSKPIIWVYLIGGITGNLFEFFINFLFYGNPSVTIIGASGSVMAIFMAIAIFKPDLKVRVFGVLELKIIYLAAFYFLLDFVNLGTNDGVAHFAHLGGALVGFLYARNPNLFSKLEKSFVSFQFPTFRKKKGMKKPIYNSRPVSDETYNARKKENQERVDAILDKISKYGYEGLSSEEKAFLFDQSHHK